MKGKYIVIRTKLGEMPILFSDSIVKCKFGFFKSDENGFYCLGESNSLDISSRGQEDADLMDIFFYLGK